jgi:hypothetical protein
VNAFFDNINWHEVNRHYERALAMARATASNLGRPAQRHSVRRRATTERPNI